ncbi:arginine repressor, partial [Gardnerella vaginalis]
MVHAKKNFGNFDDNDSAGKQRPATKAARLNAIEQA